jgi:hypothetical protein
MQGVGAQHPVVSFMDVPALMKSLRGQDPENDDLHAFETALDLKTVDTVASWLDTSEEKTRVHYVARLSGENRALAALRTRAARREIGGFFSDAYGLVQAGTLMDGKVQWRRLKDMIVDSLRAADEDPKDFVYSVERVEQVFGTKLDDLMEDVTDYAVGLRAGKRGYEAPPEVLLALRMKDVQRARDTMAKAEKGAIGQYEAAEMKESDIDGVRVRILAAPTADGDYAWALVGDYLLLSRRSSIVIDAVRTWKDKRSVFENGPIKRMFAGLQDPCSKLLLINPTGFLPPIERNPHAPPPPMIGATSVEDDRRIEAVIDYTQMGAILRFVFGLFQTRGAQVD